MTAKAPYKGLRPYEESDADNFFGREGETRILIDKILVHKLTLLFAASGIGKSSLLQAALQPALKRPASPDHEPLDVVYCNDWVSDPGSTLKTTVVRTLKDQGKLPRDYPFARELSLADFLLRCTLFSSDPLILILDQFEEFFNYQRNKPEFRPFVRELSAAIRDAAATRFVFSMREDFALELNAFKPELPTLLFDNYYRLEALSCDKARKVIQEPLAKIGYGCEEALLKTLLNKLGHCDKAQDDAGEGGNLLLSIPALRIEPPQIQIICMQLWEKEQAAGSSRLRLATYKAMREIDGLLENYFNAKLEPLSQQQKGLASHAFEFLVSSQGTKMAYPLFELVKRTGSKDPKALESVLNKLEQARILRRQKRMISKDGEFCWESDYELYHDLFAKPVNDWNQDYKRQRRVRQTLFGLAGLVVGGIVSYGAYTILIQSINHHLLLSPPVGHSDRIELWSGTRYGLDMLGLREYQVETRFDRYGVEPDKQFQQKTLGEYQELNLELIGQLPLVQRIDAYRQAGLDNRALELAKKALFGKDRDLSEKVRAGLVEFHNIDVIPIMERFITNEPDPKRKMQVVRDMRWLPVVQALPLLAQASKDSNSELKTKVSRSLSYFAGQPGGEQAAAPLVGLLKDTAWEVRSSAAEALGRYAGQPGSEQAVAPLVGLLKDTAWDVRSSAARALGNYAGQPGSEQAVAPLVGLLKDTKRRSALARPGRWETMPASREVNRRWLSWWGCLRTQSGRSALARPGRWETMPASREVNRRWLRWWGCLRTQSGGPL